MTPIELVESDDDDPEERRERQHTRDNAHVTTDAGAIEQLYGRPQHEADHQPDEQKEAFYGEPQHERVEECLWGEPFPWLLDTDEEEARRKSTRSSTELELRRLDRE